jgi:hypothetical protein
MFFRVLLWILETLLIKVTLLKKRKRNPLARPALVVFVMNRQGLVNSIRPILGI